MLYFGMHQPRFRNFALPGGSYRIDMIDTWNMTVDSLAENASGDVRVELPRRKYLALRVVRNT